MKIGGIEVGKGERHVIDLEIARLYDSTEMMMSVEVIRGHEDGPTLFLSGAIHGDEVNGTEIIRQLLLREEFKSIRGSILAVPVVNAYGFNTKSRYLPDRRDLNRTFPGAEEGSLASRLAHIFVNEIVNQSTHGIDFHTGAVNRSNYPQIRACMDAEGVEAMANDFAAPITMNEPLREGSLREYCAAQNIPVILYEGGEALRYSERAIDMAIKGTLSVMARLDMIDYAPEPASERHTSRVAAGSHWLRAPESGLLVSKKKLGENVVGGETIGIMTDAFNRGEDPIIAPYDGIIIGATTTPLLNQGDAAFHLAHYE
jgi:predicted deacylase